MKTPVRLMIAGYFALLTLSASAADVPAQPSPAATTKEKQPAPTPPPSAKPPSSTAESQAVDAAVSDHIKPKTAGVVMKSAPPKPHVEKKPPLPSPGLVWVAGHWTPVKGEWQWTPGEWRIPVTPISVWIEATYDPKTKLWVAGYWQPDREETYPREPEAKPADNDQLEPKKFL